MSKAGNVQYRADRGEPKPSKGPFSSQPILSGGLGREKAKAAKKDRKNVTVGRKTMSKVLDNVIFPKIVQCDEIDVQINVPCTDGCDTSTFKRSS